MDRNCDLVRCYFDSANARPLLGRFLTVSRPCFAQRVDDVVKMFSATTNGMRCILILTRPSRDRYSTVS